MEKRITVLIVIGTVLLAVVLLAAGFLLGRSLQEPKTVVLDSSGEEIYSTNFSPTANTITVVGHTKLNVKPEVALISLGIDICDPDAQKANLQINDSLASVIAGLQEIGLDKTEVVPSDFSLYPMYNGNSQLSRVIAFCARNRIKVMTTKIDRVSEILDKAIETGATNVYGVDFTAKDIEAASQEGIRLAYQDAEKQAQTLANTMNMSIRSIVSSSVAIDGYLLDNFVGYSGGGGGVNPQEGELIIEVTVVYEVSK